MEEGKEFREDSREKNLEEGIKKTVSSTVFDRGFPWDKGQMPRQGLEVSSLLKE